MTLSQYGCWKVFDGQQPLPENAREMGYFLHIANEDMFFHCVHCDKRSKGLDKLWVHEHNCKGIKESSNPWQ